MTGLGVVTVVAALLTAPTVSAATTYRDAGEGVEVRISRGVATIRFSAPQCADGSLQTRVRRRRIDDRARLACEPGAARATRRVAVSARVRRRRVVGTAGGVAFTAVRGAAKPTPAQRCRRRGLTLAESESVRAFRDGDATIACRRDDGEWTLVAREWSDADGYYSSGTRAWSVRAEGTRIAYAHAPFDTAESKYQSGPPDPPTVVVRDLATGTEARVDPELDVVEAVALLPYGRVAWAGAAWGGTDVFVKTLREGRVVTLDSGRIVAASLRAEGDGFAWDREPTRR